MHMNISKQVLLMGAGAGTGVLVPIVLKKYVDPQYPTGIFGMPFSTAIPLITGGIGLAAGLFTHYLGKFGGFKDFILMYSFSAFVGGFFAYASSQGWWGTPARARANMGVVRGRAGFPVHRQYAPPTALGTSCGAAVLQGLNNCTGTNQIYRANCQQATGMSLGCGGQTIIA